MSIKGLTVRYTEQGCLRITTPREQIDLDPWEAKALLQYLTEHQGELAERVVESERGQRRLGPGQQGRT